MFGVYQAYIEQDAAIQKLQNLRNIDVQTVCLIPPFINFKCLISCILFNIGPTNTKNEMFSNLNVFFLTMWVSCCLSHNERTST